MPRVVLTGFMATGKTEVGRRLARALGWPFIDTDKLVEASAGRSVRDIFATEGEAAFRDLERQAVARACAMPEAVIATGGGALLDPDNRRRLAAAGPIICLTATPEDILTRTGNGMTRPLLAGAADREERLARIRALLADRAPAYAVATHTVDTHSLPVEQVTERVRALVVGR